MRQEDVVEVAEIERLCFSMPWPTSAYRRELKTPDTNRYIVARCVEPTHLHAGSLSSHTLTALAHPELDDHEKLFKILPAEKELGMELTSAFQLIPEQSTAAIIVHHPEAKYYAVRTANPVAAEAVA